MAISIFVVAAAAAAQAAAPQASAAQPAAVQPAPEQATATTSGAISAVDPEQARAPGLAQAQQALAATTTAPKGAVLWRNIEDGMSVAQLRALYPQGKGVDWRNDRTVLTNVPIMEGCEAKVNIMHPDGLVKEIVMRGEGAIAGRCSLKLITALSGKYGEPLEKDKVRGSLFAREGKNYVWSHDGVALQFKRYTNGPLGGGGLLAASWELRYSVSPTNIDL